jgi:pyridinium-3,5-biscarboxylic acid mononucleotide synthase
MHAFEVEQLARRLLGGQVDLAEFVRTLAQPTLAEFDEVTLDLDRTRRCGFPEVVYGEGKSAETIEKIFRRLQQDGLAALATRVSEDKAKTLRNAFPDGRYNATARTFRLPAAPRSAAAEAEKAPPAGRVALITAGSSDLPVAEEARETLQWMGIEVVTIHDVGVAGPHRLPAQLHKFRDADAVIVVAGMEGALPSVVGGFVDCPVVAVPTSVGYGAAFGGIAALLGMLNSCASNVTVVNIDAGFKGAYIAGLIASRRHAPRN